MPSGIYKHKPLSIEHKDNIRKSLIGRKIKWAKKIGKSHKGKKLSKEHKRKLREAKLGKNNPNYNKPRSEEVKKKISEKLKGKPFSGISFDPTGTKHSIETKRKMSEYHRNKPVRFWKGKKRPEIAGENAPNWKGGINPINDTIRKSLDFKLWREKVFKRDNYTCQKTKIKGGELHPHHIRNFAEYPELRFDVNNGITLLKKVHDEFHRIYGRNNNTREQLIEFLNN